MAQFAIQHAAEIQDGPTFIIHANHLTDNFNGIISDFADRLSLVTGSTQTITGPVVFSSTTSLQGASFAGATSFTGLLTALGGVSIARASEVSSPADGTIWYNTNTAQYRFQVGGETLGFQPGAFPPYFRATAAPIYASASTFTVAYIMDRETANTTNIYNTTPITVDISTNALNGCIQSAALAGTIGTGGISSTTITGSGTAFLTDFQNGDVIWVSGGARRITNRASDTSLTVESVITITNGTAYKRGGEAPNTFYNLYAVTDGTNTGFVLYTRNKAGGDAVPDLAGYRYTQQAFAVRNDSSSNIIPFCVGHGWPYRPFIAYRVSSANTVGAPVAGTTSVLSNGTATSFTAASCASYVPPISRQASIHLLATSGEFLIRQTGDTSNGISVGNATASGNTYSPLLIETDSAQSIDYKRNAGSGGAYLSVMGFTVTEVK